MSYTACIVNHNGVDHLRDTLDAMLAQQPGPSEMLLVDSGSEDSSVDLVKTHYEKVRVIALSENRGPAAARNAAIDASIHDRLLFVDDDVVAAPECAARLLAALEKYPRAIAAMPSVFLAHQPAVVQYAGADAHFSGLMMLHACNTPAGSDESEPRTIGSLVSACFAYDRGRNPHLRFDERFFIYFEDHDFALRARIAGGDILAVASARCFHGPGSAGLSLRRTGRYARLRVVGLIRNRWQLMLKSYELRTFLLLAPVLGMYELLQLGLVARRGWWPEWLEAVRATIRDRDAVIRDRRAVQRSRAVRDRDLLRGGPLPFVEALPSDRIERVALRVLDGVMAAYWRAISPVL